MSISVDFRRFKHATLLQHAALERCMNLPAALETLHDYQRLLRRMWGMYGPLEQQLISLQEQLPLLVEPRLKTRLLQDDLQKLGLSPEQVQALPVCTQVPLLETGAQAWGCWYVLEGSTLGGQVIKRYVQQQFGAAVPLMFFAGYGERTGAMWQEFKQQVSHTLVHPAEAEQALEMAGATFEAFQAWMCGAEQ